MNNEDMEKLRVSIPFIAGQWSLPARARRGSIMTTRFNPLHCGAVVASAGQHALVVRRRHVSIPFIAGQWSLPAVLVAVLAAAAVFQSPSLRGSGRFIEALARLRDQETKVSIPFIAGQWSLLRAQLMSRLKKAEWFQSPSLRGSGRFPPPLHVQRRRERVSIPFIAGQWSLRGAGRRS